MKQKRGITSSARDEYILTICMGVIDELSKQQGIVDMTSPAVLIFAVDLVNWRYENASSPVSMPRDLQFRFHNLKINNGA